MHWANWETKHCVVLALVACVLIGSGITAYFSRRDVGITEVKIPPETIDYLKKLAKALGDLTVEFKRRGKKSDWGNRDDDRQAAKRGFQKLENDYFIVYFHEQDRKKGEFTLIKATESIELMKETFGRYPYPKDAGGRKLPLYVCESTKEYKRLSGEHSGRSVACTKLWFYPDGSTLCEGIFFSPRTYEQGDKDAAEIVAHELAHFVYFDKLKADHRFEVPTWFTEGIAEYASRNDDFLPLVKMALENGSLIPLTDLSSGAKKFLVDPIVYGEGHTVFLAVESRYGRNSVRRLVDASYHHDIDGAFREAINMALSRFEQEWLKYLRERFASNLRLHSVALLYEQIWKKVPSFQG